MGRIGSTAYGVYPARGLYSAIVFEVIEDIPFDQITFRAANLGPKYLDDINIR